MLRQTREFTTMKLISVAPNRDCETSKISALMSSNLEKTL